MAIEMAGMESALREQASGIAEVLREAVDVLGRVPDSLTGASIYSDGGWHPFVPC
jgi:hypothetical protein